MRQRLERVAKEVRQVQRHASVDQAVVAGQMRELLEALLSVNGAWDVVERSQVERAFEWLDWVARSEDGASAGAMLEKAEGFGALFPPIRTALGHAGKEAFAAAVARLVETILNHISFCTQSAARLWCIWSRTVLGSLLGGCGKPVGSLRRPWRGVSAYRRTTSRWLRTGAANPASSSLRALPGR